jgi:large subunit ribosomal protein L4
MAEKKKADAKAKPKGEVRKKKKDPIADADTADVGSTAKEFAKSAIDVFNTSNEKVSNIVLHPDVFRARVNKHLLYEAVKQYRAGARRGTHMTKNRALVSGSGKKPWRQKGTGRARVGEIRNPLWRKGGTVFGPTPRSYEYQLPKKVEKGALRAALMAKVQEGALIIVDALTASEVKTKAAVGVLKTLGVTGKALLLDVQLDEKFSMSVRNIAGISMVASNRVTARDVANTRKVIATKAAIEKLEAVLA